MFIDIDYDKRPQEAKLHLARPNKQIISVLHEKMNDSVNIKLGNINELTFSIPYYIDDTYNAHVDLIKEKMLVKFTLGTYVEWYVIDNLEDNADSTDILTVNALSLGYELKAKRVPELQEEAVNATAFLTRVLSGTLWGIGDVHPQFDAMFRSFDLSNSNKLDCILQAGETYGALIQWDTINRRISLREMNEDARFRGMTINYGRFLRSIKRTRTTDELVTRLHIFGKDGVSIHSVNPTGQAYVEDFSYFMYPFERDANRVVKSHSHYMSDALCHALLDNRYAINRLSPQIQSLTEQRTAYNTELIQLQVTLVDEEALLDSLTQLWDVAKATEDTALIHERNQARLTKHQQVLALKERVAEKERQIEALDAQVDSLRRDIEQESGFTQALWDELNPYIIEAEWRDDRYADPVELYQDGMKRFDELRQPKVVIDVTIENLMNLIEEQYYWDKLVLGDLIKVKYPQMDIEYMAKIIEIRYDLQNNEASVVIANTKDLLSETDKLVQLLYGSTSASTIIENNKYKWDKVHAVEREVGQIISQEWDANKRRITAGVNNSVEIGNRGLIVRDPNYPQEMLILQSGIMALSSDGGETWKTAVKPDGIVAERLIGKLIAGEELLITNRAGSFTFDANGVRIDADSFVVRSGSGGQDVNLRDVWSDTTGMVNAIIDDNMITAYEKKMLKYEWVKIEETYRSITARLALYYPDGGVGSTDVQRFHEAFQELETYLFVTRQTDDFALLDEDNLTHTTRINRQVFEDTYTHYDRCKERVEEVMAGRIKEMIQDAEKILIKAREDIQKVLDDTVYKIELLSQNGFLFSNGLIDTTITATVYRGSHNITQDLPPSSFRWKKYDTNGQLDETWTQRHIGVGNVLHVTEEDVYRKATFHCDVDDGK